MKVPYDPVVYFGLFALSNLLVVHSPLSLSWKLWILLGGVFLPFLFFAATQSSPPSRAKPAFQVNEPLALPVWVWLALGAMVFFLRFWGVTDPAHWPGGDEALTGTSAIELLQRWHWNLFQNFSQVSTLLSRLTAFFLSLTGSSFFSLRFPPLLLSLLTIAMGVAAARQFFSKSTCFLVGVLLALGYWPVWVGRHAFSGVWIPLWECWVFYNLGRLWNASSPRSKRTWALVLGFSCALGPLTIDSWQAVSLFVLLVMIGKHFGNPGMRSSFLPYFLSFALSLSPFLLAAFTEGYGRHILAVSAWKNFSSWMDPLTVAGSYLSLLVWGSKGLCVPPWGGFLSPLYGAAFFLGLMELYRFRRQALPRSLFLASFLFLLPGFLSNGVESFRIIPLLPILAVLTAIGLGSLLARFRSPSKILLLTALVAASAGMDAVRMPPFRTAGIEGDAPLAEGYQCYLPLRALAASQGRGLVFSEMIPETLDWGLAYSTYPFNAAWGAPSGDIQWAAVLTEIHYLPYLSKRFPSSKWLNFPPEKKGGIGRHVLGIIPMTPSNRSSLASWTDPYRILQGINLRIIALPNGRPRREILERLVSFYPSVPDDPFLQSCFFEKMLFNHSWEKTFHPEDPGAEGEDVTAILKRSFEKGYRDLVLCEKYGRLLATQGKNAEARKAFNAALRLSPGNPLVMEELGRLDGIRSGNEK